MSPQLRCPRRRLSPRLASWRNGSSADRLRDRFGESAVSLGSAMGGSFRELTHQNPAGFPAKRKPE
jgi:hypothetical protein